jgi:ATP-dependent phosphofructokinase / diphosphate-dependent phosphofructokinase
MAKRIALLTVGGDAPGQNVCLKSLVYSATDEGFDVIGIRKGWEGLLQYNPDDPLTHGENVMSLSKVRVRDIDRMPGSFLHSSRIEPCAVAPQAVPAFLRRTDGGDSPVDMTEHLKRVIAKLQLDALIVLGDRSGLTCAARLSRDGVPIIGIPKTVHNNISGSDYALGFSTALGRGVRFIHEVRAMAGSREEIAVVELLGRNTGLTTMLISFLAGADRALIPEIPFDPEKLAALLTNDKRANPNNYAILALSEATSIEPQLSAKYLPELSRLANSRTLAEAIAVGERERIENQILSDLAGRREVGARVIGSGAVVTEILENLTGQRILFQPLSYLIRTGEPDGQDLLGAVNFATRAVGLLTEGKTGRLVAYRQRENYVDCPLDAVTQPLGNIRLADFYDSDEYCARVGILWAARV